MKVFTLMAALSLAAHSWIGLWSVFTDYLTERMLGPKGNVRSGCLPAGRVTGSSGLRDLGDCHYLELMAVLDAAVAPSSGRVPRGSRDRSEML
jgi:hypothetical protein